MEEQQVPDWWNSISFDCDETDIFIAGVDIGVLCGLFAEIYYNQFEPSEWKITDVTIGRNGASIKGSAGYKFICDQIEGRHSDEIEEAIDDALSNEEPHEIDCYDYGD